MTLRDRFRWVGVHVRPVLKPAIAFEFWSTLLFVVSLFPASGWLLDRLVAQSGQHAVADHDLLAFAFSVPGVLFILLNATFVLAFLFAEQAALLLIIISALRGARVDVTATLYENLRRFPALLRLGLRQAVVYLLLALPFLGGAALTHRLLLSEWDFYFYLNVRPREWWIAVAIMASLGLAYLALAARLYVGWAISVPTLLFERVSPTEALRRSWRQTRGRGGVIAAPLVVLWLTVIVTSTVSTWLIGLVAAQLLAEARSLAVVVPIVFGTLGVLAIVDLGWFMAGKIVHVMLMTRNYLLTTDRTPESCVAGAPRSVPVSRTIVRIGAMAVCLVFVVTGLLSSVALLDHIGHERHLDVTGHRGSKRRAPENTLAAIQQAIDEGADFAEIDVQTTADGVVVLLHDADLMRVASLGRRIGDLDYASLQSIDVGSWFDPAFRDERIPTLQAAIDLARDRINLNIELKYTREDPDLARRTGEVIRQNEFADQCVVSSLNLAGLAEIRRGFPELEAGLIVFQAVGDVARMDFDFLSLSAARVTPGLVRSVHRRGGAVHVWTVNDPGNALSMIEMDVDNIITDEPRMIRQLVNEWNGLTSGERVALMLRNLVVGLDAPEPDEL